MQAPALGDEGLDHLQGLNAVDGPLHGGGEILDAQADAVEAHGAQRVPAIRLKFQLQLHAATLAE